MTIAITGATGQLGRIAIQALKSRVQTASIVGLARNPAKLADLAVEARAFDYTKPETLAAALDGIDVLALVSSSEFENRVGQHQNVINAAKAAGVGRIIYTSILKADQSPLLIAQDHKRTEDIIMASGLTYTILRNPWYVENWTVSLPMAVQHGAMIGATGGATTTAASRQDLGEALAAVAAQDGHENRIYELGADTAFGLDDMAAMLSKAVGKTITYTDLAQDAYAQTLTGFGLPAGFAAVIADAEAGSPQGWLSTDSGDLSRLIARPTTTLEQAVATALAV